MKNVTAKVKNLLKLSAAYESLSSQDTSIPERMGIICGPTGAGKTTGVAWLMSNINGVYVRASQAWTPNGMLGKILLELGATPLRRNLQMLDLIVERLAMGNRPVFIDEARYLFDDIRLLNLLRDIHDLAGVPIILIGLKDLPKRVISCDEQLSRRVAQVIEFTTCDISDARRLADTCCEVLVDDPMLEEIHRQAKGAMGLMVLGLSDVERKAKSQQWEAITYKQWKELSKGKPLFLTRQNKGKGGVNHEEN
jgi:DNA transposition AAA+ family ATPase